MGQYMFTGILGKAVGFMAVEILRDDKSSQQLHSFAEERRVPFVVGSEFRGLYHLQASKIDTMHDSSHLWLLSNPQLEQE
jgi:hypothetical protein